jgi:hypothetical protein
MMRIGKLDHESPAYQQAREALLTAEKDLRDQRETVAELRRQLPLDTAAEDYVLQSTDGPCRNCSISGPATGAVSLHAWRGAGTGVSHVYAVGGWFPRDRRTHQLTTEFRCYRAGADRGISRLGHEP